jgi:phosphatidylglycerol:prolipoprotein diacylglycerol transferase
MIEFFPARAVALSLFGFDVHWYGLLYLAGFLLAAFLLPRLQRHRGLVLTTDTWLSLLSWSVLGVVIGGRLGYVLFYEPEFFFGHPLEIVAVWRGGMSFHGGFIGSVLVLFFFSRANRISFLQLADVVVIPVAIGLTLGRVGNFINQELYGTVTDLPWGMSFSGADGLRHPLQLYGVVKDLLIAAACFWHLRRSQFHPAGQTAAIFCILYGIGRFLLEYVRDQQYAMLDIGGVLLSRGQVITLPIFVTGLVLFLLLEKKNIDHNL